jgi:O-antigen/teichoic acid export membrane protein
MVTILTWSKAWYEMNLDIARSELKLKMFGVMAIMRSALFLAMGSYLAFKGMGSHGIVWSLVVAFLLASFWPTLKTGWKVQLRKIDWTMATKLIRYGLPLTATFAFSFIITNSDRILLSILRSKEEVGYYGSGYDVAKQLIGIFMMIINLAAFPIITRTLEKEGRTKAWHKLQDNFILLTSVSIPLTLGIIILAPNLAHLFIGQAFREHAVRIIPWAAIAMFMSGMKIYYFDLAFQFSEKTKFTVWVLVLAALVNLSLNFLWIPKYGTLGAAWSTVFAYGVGLSLSWFWGRKLFPIPIPWKHLGKLVIPLFFFSGFLWVAKSHYGVFALLVQGLVGSGIYLTILWYLDIGNIRTRGIENF